MRRVNLAMLVGIVTLLGLVAYAELRDRPASYSPAGRYQAVHAPLLNFDVTGLHGRVEYPPDTTRLIRS